MNTNQLMQVALIEDSTGGGTVTRGMIRERAVELALNDGRLAHEASQSDWEQARQELESELAEQDKEHQKILTGIKSLLQKGRELQVRDFKEMLAGIKRQSN